MKFDKVVLATKAFISNDTDPSGEKTRNRGTQRNKKVWNSKNMVRMIKWNTKEEEMKKQCSKVQPKFKQSLRFSNDGNCVQNGGAQNYFFTVFLGIKTRFNLIYYKSGLDERMKTYNGLKLEPQLITSYFLKLRTTVALLFF